MDQMELDFRRGFAEAAKLLPLFASKAVLLAWLLSVEPQTAYIAGLHSGLASALGC